MTDVEALIAFIRVNLDRDERIARRAAYEGTNGEWRGTPDGLFHVDADSAHPGAFLADVYGAIDERYFEHIALHDPARVLRQVAATRARLAFLEDLGHDMGDEDFPTFSSCRMLPAPGDLGDVEVGYCSCGRDALRLGLYRIEAQVYSDRDGYNPDWSK